MIRLVPVGAALALALAGVGNARAAGGGEISGVVRDARGQPLADVDLVLTPVTPGPRASGPDRRAAVSDRRGGFFFSVPDPGRYQLLVFSERGARVQARMLELRPGGRLHLELARVDAGVSVGESAVPWLPATRLGPAALGGERDLASALAATPGGAGVPGAGDGPLLLGTDAGEVELRLEGFSLNDPVEGRAPWQLPAALWGHIRPHAGLGLATAGDRAVGSVDLGVGRAERLQALTVSGGLGVGEGAGEEGNGSDGRVAGSFLEGRGELVRSGGRLRTTLALAPTRGPWQADPGSVSAPRIRRRWLVPALGRVDGALGGWSLTGVGLAVHERQELGRAGRVLEPEQPAAEGGNRFLVGLVGRRPLGPSPAELILRAGLLGRRQREESLVGATLATDSRRLTLASEIRGGGDLGGLHVVSAAVGLEAEAADRQLDGGAARAGKQAGRALLATEASSVTPHLAADERYLPIPSLELTVGMRLARISLDASGDSPTGPLPERSFSTGFLLAPRGGVVFRPLGGRLRFHATAGRWGGRLPLAALLDTTASPPFGAAAPAEDAGQGGVDVRLGALSLSVAALERRLAHMVEDRFSPANGQLELYAPPYARRRYRAAWAELRASAGGFDAAVAIIRSSLRGNHSGSLDAGTGRSRPAATEAFDTPAGDLNRDGALPGDRPYGLRVLLEHGRWLGPGLRLEAALGARLDGGTPLEATAPNPENPLSRVFLVERGSLGRTRATAAVDAALGVAWNRGGRVSSLRLELANLGNRRAVLSRDSLYTDVPVSPTAGARSLAGVTDATGAPLGARPGYGRAVTTAPPLSLRLVVGVAL